MVWIVLNCAKKNDTRSVFLQAILVKMNNVHQGLLASLRSSNNNNNLFEKQQNEWFVPQIVTILIEAGQDEYRNTL